MFHIHKWGEIKDRYQYCTKCGKARPVKCAHVFELIEKYKIMSSLDDTKVLEFGRVLQCKHCGVLTVHEK